MTTLGADDLLTGEDLQPGFTVQVRELFRQAEQELLR
jgi:hypothetical protein